MFELFFRFGNFKSTLHYFEFKERVCLEIEDLNEIVLKSNRLKDRLLLIEQELEEAGRDLEQLKAGEVLQDLNRKVQILEDQAVSVVFALLDCETKIGRLIG